MREKDKNRQRERKEAGGGRDMKKLKKGKRENNRLLFLLEAYDSLIF